MSQARRLILAGDHKQLPPTVKTTVKPDIHDLTKTMMDRLLGQYGPDISCVLEVQYRMNSCICKWASDAMYNGW